MSRIMSLFRRDPHLGLRSRKARSRRRGPIVETLEGRQLLAIDFTSAIGIGGAILTPGHIATDASGDTVIAGTFQGSVNFDPSKPGGDVLNSGNTPNAFVVKYSPTNTLIWVKQFADDESVAGGSVQGYDVAVDRNTGSIYVAGSFSGKADFDPGGNTLFLTSAGGSDGYVAKLDSDGNLDSNLVDRFGGAANDSALSVSLDRSGTNVYVTGSYINAANFDPGRSNTTLTSPVLNETDSYALKLSNNLGFGFAARVGVANSIGDSVAADSQGGVYVTGTVFNTNNINAFVSKFNAVGNPILTRQFGGPASGGMVAQGTGVAVDGADNVYLSGVFEGTGVNFNKFNGTGTAALDSAGSFDAYVLKLDPSLTLSYARRFGSNKADEAFDVSVDGANNVYLAGTEAGQSTFGTTGPGTLALDTGNGVTGTANAFVLVVNGNGDLQQAVGAKGTGPSLATSIDVSDSGRVALAGIYFAPAVFGNTTLPSVGPQQFFVAGLEPTTNGGGMNGGGNGTGNNNGGSNNGGSNNGGTNNGGGTQGGGGTMTMPPPTVQGEARIFRGRGRRRRLAGFQLSFSGALNAAEAGNIAHYHVTQPGRRHRVSNIAVRAATYNPANNTVTLTLGRINARRPLQLTATGLLGATGTPLATVVTNL